MSSQVQKRKHKTLTIKEKCDILDRLNRNESFSSLASEYGVERSTIYDIKKNHEKIKQFVSTTDCGPGKRQTLKKAEHPEVKKLWPDIVATPTNDPQISVPSEVIEQIAAETQISPENLETWCRGIDKEENIFHEMSDDEIIKEISRYTTINQEDDDEVIATTPQVKAEEVLTPLSWVCNGLNKMVHPTTNFYF
ncbi:unnamed protein product [Parnassius apollo]|uniref:(apollo) hypothetical protein n=1 Tax=Parnassius apollo TaxID=110799 RepID=A0A8S3WX34_PARAO|nr:unnamed protein product [Parnassius apollo]